MNLPRGFDWQAVYQKNYEPDTVRVALRHDKNRLKWEIGLGAGIMRRLLWEHGMQIAVHVDVYRHAACLVRDEPGYVIRRYRRCRSGRILCAWPWLSSAFAASESIAVRHKIADGMLLLTNLPLAEAEQQSGSIALVK